VIIATTGWRHYTDGAFIRHRLDLVHALCIMRAESLHVRFGDADGADAFVRHWCVCQAGLGVTYQMFVAYWDKLENRAGPERNERMLTGLNDHVFGPTELLLAFPRTDGKPLRSPGSGTIGCVIRAYELGINVEIPAYRHSGE